MSRFSALLLLIFAFGALLANASAQAADTAPAIAVNAFPNCPAPAVHEVDTHVTHEAAGDRLAIFVLVQNVGRRGFAGDASKATLTVRMGGIVLGVLPLHHLLPGEVQHLSLVVRLAKSTEASDLSARLDLGDGVPSGRVAESQDCDPDDNEATRSGADIRASLDNVAG